MNLYKNGLTQMKNLKLKNGQTAVYTHTDYWDRPCYELIDKTKVCCINLNGTYLHSMTHTGEPEYPLGEDWQPVK